MSKLVVAAPGQMDLLEVLEDAKRDLPAPCLFNSPARGLAARAAEFEAWQDAYGSFGSLLRSHAWTLAGTSPGRPTDRCQATALDAHVRTRDRWDPGPEPECGCTLAHDALLFRGACTGCDWEGQFRSDGNAAVEDACGHAWPGWRDLPAVPRRPPDWSDSKKAREARARWAERVNAVYPAGWLEAGGPIRTRRRPMEGRHVPSFTGFGGYDMAIPLETGDGE